MPWQDAVVFFRFLYCFHWVLMCFPPLLQQFQIILDFYLWLSFKLVFTNILKATLRPLKCNKKFRHTFLYLCLGIIFPLHPQAFTYQIMVFIFMLFNCLVTFSSENCLLPYSASLRVDDPEYIFAICDNSCELIISSIFHITSENMEQQKRPECRFLPALSIYSAQPSVF